jgi:transcriptional antiterminator RfaH
MSEPILLGLSADARSERAWYCVRSQPKHEHIAAASLRLLEGIEVFNPRIRMRKVTRRGPVWFNEALFPNYVFARFELRAHLHQVRHAMGVSGVVHFGDRWPGVAESEIEALRQCMEGGEVKTEAEQLGPGDEVTVVARAFYGVPATVLKTMPSKQRVRVLLEILGRTTVVEVANDAVVPVWRNPASFQVAAVRTALVLN